MALLQSGTFGIFPAGIIESHNLGAHEQLVLSWLWYYKNNETGKAFPSIARLAGKTGLSKSSVKRAVNALNERHIIVKRVRKWSGGHQTNEYEMVLQPPPISTKKGEQKDSKDRSSENQGMVRETPGVGSERTKGMVRETPGVGSERAPNYKKSNNKNITRKIYSRSEAINVFKKNWRDKPTALIEAHAVRFYNYYQAKDFKIGGAAITDLGALARNWTFYGHGGKKVKELRDDKFNELLEKFKNKALRSLNRAEV